MIDLRIAVAGLSGFGVGALAALSAVHATMSAAEATALAAGAAAVAALGAAGALWLDAVRPRESESAFVVFLVFVALGLMLGAGGHA